MFMKLLNYALKHARLDRALNRTPLACKSNTVPIWLRRYTGSYVTIELHNQTRYLLYIRPHTFYSCNMDSRSDFPILVITLNY